MDDSNTFEIRFKTGAFLKDLKVSSVKLADVKWDHDATKNGKMVEYSLADTNALGILKVSSFALPNMDRYLFQLDSIFNDLKEKDVRDLVLDLRDNRGGHPIFAAQLLSYLTDQEFVYFKRNEDVKDFEPLYNTMQPNESHFNGNIYVFQAFFSGSVKNSVGQGFADTLAHEVWIDTHHGDPGTFFNTENAR